MYRSLILGVHILNIYSCFVPILGKLDPNKILNLQISSAFLKGGIPQKSPIDQETGDFPVTNLPAGWF